MEFNFFKESKAFMHDQQYVVDNIVRVNKTLFGWCQPRGENDEIIGDIFYKFKGNMVDK